MYKICLALILVLTQILYAQFIPDLSYHFLADPNANNGSYQSKVENVQAMFIEELFVKQLFETEATMIIDDEDDMSNLKESNKMMNMMFAREISKYLAKQDLLGMKKYYYNEAFE